MQMAVVSELLLGEFELLAAGFDGEAEGDWEGGGSGHDASLYMSPNRHNDIRVDIAAYIPLRFQQYDIAVEVCGLGGGGWCRCWRGPAAGEKGPRWEPRGRAGGWSSGHGPARGSSLRCLRCCPPPLGLPVGLC